MKRSARITLRLVPVVSAAFLAGCGPPTHRACVDETKRIVDDADCGQANGSTGSWGSTNGTPHFFRWYWFHGSSTRVTGTFAPPGGDFTEPMSLSRIDRAMTTTRGGFGSTAHGSVGE
jgi:hypothetical protein